MIIHVHNGMDFFIFIFILLVYLGMTGASGGKVLFDNIKADGLITATFLYSPTMVADAVKIAAIIVFPLFYRGGITTCLRILS